MSIDFTFTPASGTVRAVDDAVRVDVSGATENTLTGYNAGVYPSSPENRYYLSFEKTGADTLRSYVFSVNADGEHQFNNFVFPDDGAWTVHLRKSSDDTSVANEAVTVAAQS